MSGYIVTFDGVSLCPEAAKRAAMSDAEFWEHVFFSTEPQGTPAFDPDDHTHYDLDYDLAVKLADPCPECGATGACGWDAEGRPMIHVTEDGA